MNSCFYAGIKKIEIAQAEDIWIERDEIFITNGNVVVLGNFEEIAHQGLASVEYEMKREGADYLYSTLLKFRCHNYRIDNNARLIDKLTSQDLVYKITTVSNKKYLLNTNEKPFTTVSISFRNGNRPTDVQICEVEVKYVNTFTLLNVN